MYKSTPHISSPLLPERWLLVDADGQIVGRVATAIAKLLMGKDQPQYNSAVDAKTNVVVINAQAVKFSGKKTSDKTYSHHTGYLGHLKTRSVAMMMAKQPTKVLGQAVSGMLPKNKLRKVMLGRLKIYADAAHPHEGQQPVQVKL
ncbi:MAG: 50S ribosomal protein L13, large subunit ribosomal protein L13 [candidate division Kazan bacterium GW2011_GWA1_50_15]|uniref:Large ribosomal subunit protein uL13 n=2 Tax=Bacteria division Kazan-3B-28 TaxID=1798534 RepID=A0A0G1ZFS2_UNCK3|nr:MAG: 50S ribosomal protein L13, large subunit ribosomal protein L13 [candidate division Kazan bacterium GW2011_GWA1_50_15]KKW25426.1 MAG: 50S ribosomal protein L13 [candidate division Kazan bacterium GW2011_GWC1_52_13]KKW26732.1 MAG: 50S ribosomal protein L13 [candidate division Kazan bacterium GW2011_GWB1_52_7]HAV65730.1 50S ribosomal protein L13 [Patescibacteria group bacterium]HCR42898.1 50S ribosomal protein L13 [Patescibacteria group bacterium]